MTNDKILDKSNEQIYNEFNNLHKKCDGARYTGTWEEFYADVTQI